MKRIIFHYDMDMFYAQVEIRDDPSLKDLPVIIGANPYKRGIVTTCNYIARKYGVHSGMSSTEAYTLCPNAKFILPTMDKYEKESEQIQEVILDYSDIIEFVALDEGYIDMTHTKQLFHSGDIEKTAKEIQRKIYRKTYLTSSIGIGYNKYTAKLASEYNKPRGFFNIKNKKQYINLFSNKNVKTIYGVGPKTKEKLEKYGIITISDIRQVGVKFLKEKLGKPGVDIYYMANGIDHRPVYSNFEEVGIGNSKTQEKDLMCLNEIKRALLKLIEKTSFRIQNKNIFARTVTVKLRYSFNFKLISRSKTVNPPISSVKEIYSTAKVILNEKVSNYSHIRLVGIRLSNFTKVKSCQLSLFDNNQKYNKFEKLDKLEYKIKKKYGFNIIKHFI